MGTWLEIRSVTVTHVRSVEEAEKSLLLQNQTQEKGCDSFTPPPHVSSNMGSGSFLRKENCPAELDNREPEVFGWSAWRQSKKCLSFSSKLLSRKYLYCYQILQISPSCSFYVANYSSDLGVLSCFAEGEQFLVSQFFFSRPFLQCIFWLCTVPTYKHSWSCTGIGIYPAGNWNTIFCCDGSFLVAVSCQNLSVVICAAVQLLVGSVCHSGSKETLVRLFFVSFFLFLIPIFPSLCA